MPDPAIELLDGQRSGIAKGLVDGRQRRPEVRRLRDVVDPDHGQVVGDPSPRLVGRVEDPEGHLVVAGEHRVDARKSLEQSLQRELSAHRAPVALHDQPVVLADPVGVEHLAPAVEAFLRLPPVERTRDDGDAPGTAGDQVLGGHPADRAVVDADGWPRGLAGHPADEGHRDRRVRAALVRPAAIAADLGDRPDDAVHLAPDETVEDAVDVSRPRLVEQGQRDRVAKLRGPLLDPGQHARRSEVVESVGHDAEGVAAALGEPAREQVRGVARVGDDPLDPLEGLGRDVRPVVQDPRHRLGRDAGCLGHFPDRDAAPSGHEPSHRRRGAVLHP